MQAPVDKLHIAFLKTTKFLRIMCEQNKRIESDNELFRASERLHSLDFDVPDMLDDEQALNPGYENKRLEYERIAEMKRKSSDSSAFTFCRKPSNSEQRPSVRIGHKTLNIQPKNQNEDIPDISLFKKFRKNSKKLHEHGPSDLSEKTPKIESRIGNENSSNIYQNADTATEIKLSLAFAAKIANL